MKSMRIPIFLSLALLLSLPSEIFGQTVQVDKKAYLPGSTARVTYNCAGLCKSDAWIGIIPSNIAHGSEATNDQNDLTYQYLNNKSSGTLTFKVPNNEGRFDFRMHDTDGGGKELASVSFEVSKTANQVSSSGQSSLKIDKTQYAPNANIVVYYNCLSDCKENGWIGIIPSNIAHGSEATNDQHDLTYQYLGKNSSGTLTFKAPGRTGRYDFRMHDKDGGGKEVASVSFVVSSGGSSGSQQTMSTIFNNWNKTVVQNKPSKAPQISINSSTLISKITNYHWNNGRGKTPGYIWLVDGGGNILGPWQAVGTSGTGGAQNVNWVVTPNIRLSAGRYTIMDSDINSWSQNSQSSNVGFSTVEGKK
jgi:hypothetical protein